jgi:general secretion pathway protein D
VRATIANLMQAFDIDLLAGQSYALLPAGTGDAKDFASALQDAFRAQSGGALAGLVRVVPMTRVNAVLVIASQALYIEDARRVYALVERARRATVRSWHVYYLQNSHANDAAYVLQRAFTPNDVTAQPSDTGQTGQPGMAQGGIAQLGGAGSGIGGGSIAGATLGAGIGGGAFGGGGNLSLSAAN